MSNIQVCPTCDARMSDNHVYWSTGKIGTFLDLAGLVCNPHANGRPCINPCKGLEGGDTHAKREGDRKVIVAKMESTIASKTLSQ